MPLESFLLIPLESNVFGWVLLLKDSFIFFFDSMESLALHAVVIIANFQYFIGIVIGDEIQHINGSEIADEKLVLIQCTGQIKKIH
jgi:hypothetical protein